MPLKRLMYFFKAGLSAFNPVKKALFRLFFRYSPRQLCDTLTAFHFLKITNLQVCNNLIYKYLKSIYYKNKYF